MFIYSLKVNENNFFKIILISIIFIALIILGISAYRIYNNSTFKIADTIDSNNVFNLDSNQYTNILQEVYDNVDSYIGQKINFTGYVYRLYDMQDNEFVLARDMLINSDSQSVVVGFLCTYDNAEIFKDGTWVTISGSIVKGYYHDQIPVIEINDIKQTEKPEDAFVYPPDNTYVPTSIILGLKE